MTNDLQDHLNHAVYGTKKLKPDEQKKYLGTFRERVDLTLTFEQTNTQFYLEALDKEVKLHPSYRLIVNGALEPLILTKVLKLAKKNNIQVTTTSNVSFAHDINDIALVLASKDHALHQEQIDIALRYPKAQITKPNIKKNFFKRLFE